MGRRVSVYVLFVGLSLGVAEGQDNTKPDNLPFQWAPPKQDWEWDEDERFDELMEQLAINEASLEAVQAALAKKQRRKSNQAAAAHRAEENSRMMDRKGGGPMKWNEFYGTNAEKFFYHPIDPNTTYHTNTALRQMGKAEDDKDGSVIPARQSLPVHQRPPQWDYIYQANETARRKALADASLAQEESDALERRRTQLENEQAILWCKLAFRAVQRLNMARKPLLRFELASADGNTNTADHVNALAAAARFLASALAVVEKAEQDQVVAFGGVAAVLSQARDSLEDSLLELPDLESEWESTTTDLGKFFKLSQMLADKAKTLSESYAGAMDGDANKEEARKERFRGMLQDSVVDYAQILLALNELADKIKMDWKVRVDTKRKVAPHAVMWAPVAIPDRTAQLAWGIPATQSPRVVAGTDDVAAEPVAASAPQSRLAKPSVRKRPLKPVVFQFTNEQQIKDAWDVNGEWRIQDRKIRFLDGGSMESVFRIRGDAVIQVEYVGGIYQRLRVRAWGQSFVAERSFTIARNGSDIVYEEQGKPATKITLKQEEQATLADTTLSIRCESNSHAPSHVIRAVTVKGEIVESRE